MSLEGIAGYPVERALETEIVLKNGPAPIYPAYQRLASGSLVHWLN
jgi:hypothetical protein